MSRSERRRLSAVPIMFVIVLLLVGTIATTLALPAASPTPVPLPTGSLPAFPDLTARPTETPLGRYPASTETGLVTSCVSGIDPNTVPGPIAQAFCVCTVNRYEQLYPTLDDFQRASDSGAITDKVKTDVANQCARQIVGG